MLYPLTPDPQAALITFLQGHADVSAICGTRVSSTKIDTPLPRIQVTAVPAEVTEPWEEAAEFQVDCWGGTDEHGERDALTLARTVCAAIYDIIPLLASVTQAFPTVKPFAAHDPTTGRPRFIVQVQITQSPEATP